MTVVKEVKIPFGIYIFSNTKSVLPNNILQEGFVYGNIGDLTIGDVVYLSGSTATADVEETVDIDFSVVNTGSVGGIQFDIKDAPNYLNLVSVTTTDRTAGFSADFSDVNEGANSRIIMYSPDNVNLEPGNGSVVTATFEVVNTAYADSVSLFIENVMVTDGIGGAYWIASADSGTVIAVSYTHLTLPTNREV